MCKYPECTRLCVRASAFAAVYAQRLPGPAAPKDPKDPKLAAIAATSSAPVGNAVDPLSRVENELIEPDSVGALIALQETGAWCKLLFSLLTDADRYVCSLQGMNDDMYMSHAVHMRVWSCISQGRRSNILGRADSGPSEQAA